MKTYLLSDLVKEVKVILDENQSSIPLLDAGDVDTLSLNEIIAYNIPIAAEVVENEAPSRKLGSGEALATSISWEAGKVGIGRGVVVLPPDFLRLVCFQMSDWERPVTECITDQHPKYAQQFSRNAGLRGSPQSPVVAICNMPAGTVLEFFSCEAGEDVRVSRARYIPKPVITEKHEIRMCKQLKRSIMYYAAYLVEQICGDKEKSKVYLQTATDLAK